MVIKAKRIYEPKKEDNFDIQKVLWEAIQKSITSSTDQTKQLVSEFERMSSDAWVKKLEEKFYQYIKNLRIEKEEIKQDVYKNIENRVNEIWRRVENHEHKEYLTQEDKDECINSARDMVNEAVLKFDNLFKPFLEQLNIKSDKEHSHEEFWQLQLQIEETEEELEHRIEQKADKEHKHEIEDVTWLSTTLKDFAKKDHKHDEYATREELDFINRRRSGWGWSHVIQENWVVANQRGNINFINATVTDDPDNNATVVTVTWWGGWASSYEVIQTWHWFVDLDWLYFDETDNTYKKAQSNSVDTLWAWHVVEVVDANTFKVAKEGVHDIDNVLALWEYVLSQDTAWGYTQTLPWDLWDYVLYWMEVLSWTHISFYIVPAIRVWSTINWAWTANEIAYWTDTDTLWSVSWVTATELWYLDWVTSSIQTQLNGKQSIQVIVSASQTAVNDEVYVVVASATFTDPTPVEWKWFKVIVRNGTATVWGTGYSVAWSEIVRIFHSWAWANYLKTPSSWVNTGDQTSIVWITGTLADFNTALTGADFAVLAWNTFTGNNIQTTWTSNIFDSWYTWNMFYNTADKVTNYERIRIVRSSNIFYIRWGNWWTGITRSIRIGASATWWDTVGTGSYFEVTNGTQFNSFVRSSGSTTFGHLFNTWAMTTSSWLYSHQRLEPVINQSGTAWYSALLINPTETTTGSWVKALIRGQVWWADKFLVNNDWSIELWHASDTTISRVSAWRIAVEWVNVWYLEIPQNSQSTAYTLVLWDAWKHIYHPSADTTARTWTIPANSSVAFPVWTAITFVNDTSAGTITIAITTDTLVLAWAGTTGSRTLTANWVATAIKVTSTRWIISWTNLT